MLAVILPILSGCKTQVIATDWCLNDRWICASHADTTETLMEIVTHNAGYAAACPAQPHVCK